MAMKRERGFDEVMIVNPYEPGSDTNQGVKLMRFYAIPPGIGYYAEQPEPYGYYAAPASGYGYYAAPAPGYGYYAEQPEAYGQYAAPAPGYGYYAAPHGQYGQTEPGYEPVGYIAEEYPAGYGNSYQNYTAPGAMGYYGQSPEMPAYAAPQPVGEAYPPMEGPDDGYGRYVRQTRPTFNAGCPMPTNVHGVGDAEMFDGYVRPSTVNPTCGQFTPQPGEESALPDNFKPLW
jgi:hypothetical protein